MQTPFLTLMEIVRLICNAFDIGREIKKELDNKALDKYASLPEAMSYFLKPDIYDDLLWLLGSDEACERFISKVEQHLKEYLKLVSQTPANGISRSQMRPVLFKWFAASLINGELNIGASQIQVSVLDIETGLAGKAIPTLIRRLSSASLSWQAMHQYVAKEQKDLIYSWASGEHIPDLSSLKNLLSQPGLENERSALTLARAWDYLLREFSMEGGDPSTWNIEECRHELKELLQKVKNQVRDTYLPVGIIQRFFIDGDVSLDHLESAIQHLRSIIQNCGNQYFSDFYCDSMLARARARQGRFDECLELNKQAVDKSL